MGEKGRRTRQAICQSACQLFAEKGFKDVTMKDICERTHLTGEACTGITVVHGRFS